MTNTAYTLKQATTYDKDRFSSAGGRWVHQVEVDVLASARNQHAEKGKLRILEVGCGTGRLLTEIVKSGDDAHGIDASAEMLEQFRNRDDYSIHKPHLAISEANKLPYASSSFDFVYSIRVLSLLESRDYSRASLAEMFRVLRPGGILVVGIVNSHRWLYRPRKNEKTSITNTDILDVTKIQNGRVLNYEGYFFIGIPLAVNLPALMIPAYSRIDSFLGKRFPAGANQGYYTLSK